MLILSHTKNNNINFLNAALEQLNYVTGSNAHNLSFITGTGKKSPLHPHHRPSEADGITEPIPGLIVGGPNQYLNDPVLQQHFNQDTPPALCYIDDVGSYASNEIAINWNAPLVFVAGYFNTFSTTSVEEEENFIPQGFYLDQNYPNPFNSSTIINWYSPESGWQTIKLYDTLGSELETIAEGYFLKGNHSHLFQIDSFLPSGVYYYQLRTDNSVLSKKMIYLK